MKQETGRQQPGIPFLQGGEDVNYEAYRAECARHAQAIRRVLETGRPDF